MDEIKLLSVPETIGVAFLVLAGYYGNGEERVQKLTDQGYDYNKVQDCVNELYELVKRYS